MDKSYKGVKKTGNNKYLISYQDGKVRKQRVIQAGSLRSAVMMRYRLQNEKVRPVIIKPTITKEHVCKLMPQIKEDNPEIYPLIATLATTGRRLSQCLPLELRDMERNTRKLLRLNFRPEVTKNRVPETIPIGTKLAVILIDAYQRSAKLGSKYLFCDKNGRQYTTIKVSTYLRKLSNQILGFSIGVHDLRNYFFIQAASYGYLKYYKG